MDAYSLLVELENQVKKISKKIQKNRFLTIHKTYVKISFYERTRDLLRFNNSWYLYVEENVESINKVIDAILIKPTYSENHIRIGISQPGNYKTEILYPIKDNKYYTGHKRIANFLDRSKEDVHCFFFKVFWLFVYPEELQKIKKNLLALKNNISNSLFNKIEEKISSTEFKRTNQIEITFFVETSLEELF
jgi:hypothetical protein